MCCASTAMGGVYASALGIVIKIRTGRIGNKTNLVAGTATPAAARAARMSRAEKNSPISDSAFAAAKELARALALMDHCRAWIPMVAIKKRRNRARQRLVIRGRLVGLRIVQLPNELTQFLIGDKKQYQGTNISHGCL